MKKILLTLFLLLSIGTMSAEFRWGPTAGINISNLYWKQKLISSKTLVGPNVGVMGEIMIPGIGFGVDLGLRYSMHGSKVGFGEKEIWSSTGIENQNVWFHTVQVPINLRFKWTRMDGLEHYVAPFAYAGPMFSFNVSSNDAPALEFPAASVGIQVGIGGEFLERYQLSFGYCFGVSYDCRTIKLDNFSARTNSWMLNVAVLF